jgi:hypothetical protein
MHGSSVQGDGAMQRMAQSSVLICGMGGLGVEAAKNVVLSGVKAVVVQDTAVTTVADLGTQFFLRESHIGQNRCVDSALACELGCWLVVVLLLLLLLFLCCCSSAAVPLLLFLCC